MNENQVFKAGASTKVAAVAVEVLWYLGWVAVLLSLILVIAVNFTGFYVKYTYAPVEIHYPYGSTVPFAGQDVDASCLKIVKVMGLMVEHSGKGFQRIYVFIPMLLAGLLQCAVTILRMIMRSIRKGSPFTEVNAFRIKLLGFLVMAAGPFYGFLEYLYGKMLVGGIEVPGAELSVNPDGRFIYVIIGLIIVALGQVFSHGVKLREDSELTI